MLNITFLQSAFLAGLAAIAVPIIIHMLSGRARKKQYFGSLLLLREITVRRSRSIKLRRLLLLLLRIILLSLISLIMATPMLTSNSGLRLEQDTTCANVLIIDTSMSMGMGEDTNQSFLEQAKNNLSTLLKHFTANDTMTLLAAGQSGTKLVVGPFSKDKIITQQSIEKMEPDWGRADIKGALDMAVDILKSSSAGRKRIFIFSDLQHSSWNFRYDVPKEISFFTFGRKHPVADNNSLLAGEVYSELLNRRDLLNFASIIKSTNEEAGEKTSLKLMVNDREVESRTMPPMAKGTRRENFQFLPDSGFSDVSGYFELGTDFFENDNKRYFSVSVPKTLKVLLISPASSHRFKKETESKAAFYIKQALNPKISGKLKNPQQESIISIKETKASSLESLELSKFDLVIFAPISKLEKEDADILAEYIKGGGNAAIFLGSRSDTDAINEVMSNRKSAFGHDIFSTQITALNKQGSKAKSTDDIFWGSYLKTCPLFKDFDRYFDHSNIIFQQYYSMDSDIESNDKILARFSDASPMMIESNFEDGKCILIGFSPERDWTNFPIQPTFVTFMHRLVLYSCGYLSWSPEQFHVSNNLILRVRDSSFPTQATQISLTQPSGEIEVIKDFSYKEGQLTTDYRFSEPGIYTLEAGQYQRVFAVNYDEGEIRESDFVEESDLNTLWDNRLVVLDAEEESFEKELDTTAPGQGTGLGKFLALLLLLFLLGETLLANRHRYTKQNTDK